MKNWLMRQIADGMASKGLYRFIALCTLSSLLFVLCTIILWSNFSDVNLNGWLGAILSGGAFGLSFTAILLILPRLVARVVYPLVVGWTIFYIVSSYVAMKNFGMIFRGEAVMIIAGSSWQEIWDFLKMYANVRWVCGTILFVGVEIAVVVILLRVRYFKPTLKGGWLLLLCQIPAIIWLLKFPPEYPTMEENLKACTFLRFDMFGLVEDSWKSMGRLEELSRVSKDPCLGQAIVRRDRSQSPLLGVIVIGESSTRNRWSLYGYDRDTTPMLDSIRNELVVYDNLVAAQGSTTQCLRYLLTAATKEDERCRYILPQIIHEAGFKSVFLSNQNHWGQFDGVDTILFSACEQLFWLGDVLGNGTPDCPRYDGYLLPYVDKAITESDGSQIIFVHLQGSHMPMADKCPLEFAKYGLREEGGLCADAAESDLYDNSIVYTDYVVSQILQRLKERGGDSFLLYMSDHGETPSSTKWRFVQDKDLWEIPMIAWFSREYREFHGEIVRQANNSVHKPLVSDQLLSGIVKLCLIEGLPDYKEQEDFLSDKFIPREKRYDDKVQGVK